MTLAVMGCVVNGPGESKAANIGISLPGTGEAPNCPVFIDGQHVTTLRGTYDELAAAFRELVDDYVATRYPRKTSAPSVRCSDRDRSSIRLTSTAPFSVQLPPVPRRRLRRTRARHSRPSRVPRPGLTCSTGPRQARRSRRKRRRCSPAPGSLRGSAPRHPAADCRGARPFILFSHDSSCGSMSKPGARSSPPRRDPISGPVGRCAGTRPRVTRCRR